MSEEEVFERDLDYWKEYGRKETAEYKRKGIDLEKMLEEINIKKPKGT